VIPLSLLLVQNGHSLPNRVSLQFAEIALEELLDGVKVPVSLASLVGNGVTEVWPFGGISSQSKGLA